MRAIRWALLAATLTYALGASAAPLASVAPYLRLADTAPVVVQGRSFHAGEHVRVTLVRGSTHVTRTAAASRVGAFSVSFANVSLGPCAGLAVRAVGTFGSTAALKRPPLPACMPVVSP